LFGEVDPAVATYLKNVVDTGTGTNAPTVITYFSPTFGPVGTTVTLSGYNFGTNFSVVEFDGTPATIRSASSQFYHGQSSGANATTGYITVTGTGGTDTSASEFAVTAGGTTPTFSLSAGSLTGLTADEGSAEAARCTVSGSSLTNALTVTAPTNFEVSLNNSFFSSDVSLTPVAGTLSGVPVYVESRPARIDAVSGNVTHVSGGATSQNLAVAGSVASTAPHCLTLPRQTYPASRRFEMPGISKSYTVSGAE
jgi:hypothetical protein